MTTTTTTPFTIWKDRIPRRALQHAEQVEEHRRVETTSQSQLGSWTIASCFQQKFCTQFLWLYYNETLVILESTCKSSFGWWVGWEAGVGRWQGGRATNCSGNADLGQFANHSQLMVSLEPLTVPALCYD